MEALLLLALLGSPTPAAEPAPALRICATETTVHACRFCGARWETSRDLPNAGCLRRPRWGSEPQHAIPVTIADRRYRVCPEALREFLVRELGAEEAP